ncbi:winged helix-turn-helix transcriptional regulator [Streptomyces sp. KM273126]|uniref:GntR family transcriptional regulator n=1 Tax=Streptomyces sp. KM273126 TaxID=2545247 RepID=UPI00103E9A85|nr:winged helix-turn-helix domain-containing protein [Streptomyces sp. KM273126]MBA2813054.1 winged helix-turn-helix transcriptional regulator [Streptomyces sp. KM273126]
MIDRTQPVYPQLERILRARITDGTYAPGSRMPAVLTVASEFDVAAPTVQRAFAALREDGLIITWSGRGSFVADQRI